MILIDANLLLYAYDSSSPHHVAAKQWLEQAFSRPEPVGIAWDTILAFLRITTNPRALEHPLSISEAVEIVSEWISLPMVQVVGPTDRHWDILSALLTEAQARGPLVMDANLATLAIEHGLMLYTNDRDFTRFPGLQVRNPLQN
jgi:toxin-antitoxin system PIN domain toxin